MKTSEFTTTVLKADNGKALTQVADVELSHRVIATIVALGKNDTPDNWREISTEEAEQYRILIEEDRKRQESEQPE